jgi:low temperature requirement protein LtrA
VPLRFWLWAIAFTIELATPVIAYLTVSSVPAQHSHMDERFGLFAIVVLGESLVAIAAGTDQSSWDTDASITAVAGFVIAICAWSLYFDRSSETVIHDALRSDRLGMSRSFVYGYGHVFVFIGLLVTAVGVNSALESLQHPTPNPLGALCAGLAVYLAGTSIIQGSTLNALSARVILARVIACGLAVVSMLAAPAVGVPLSVAFVALVLILLTLVERYELLVESTN